MSNRAERLHFLTAKQINRVRITGKIVFYTAFHLGSGESGQDFTDMAVLRDVYGKPLLPGSSLKGVFRSTAERLSQLIEMSTCFLDKNSNSECPGANEKLYEEAIKSINNAKRDEEIDRELSRLCDTCFLFGSGLARGRTFFYDASYTGEGSDIIERRDGVGIDRDSGTAVEKVKYDFQVIPRGAEFQFTLLAENVSPKEELLLKLTALEWSREVRLGGKTTRGLGGAKLEDLKYEKVDFSDKSQLVPFLIDGTYSQEETIEALKETVRKQLETLLGAQ